MMKKEKLLKYLDLVVYWAIVVIPFAVAIAPGMAFAFMGIAGAHFLLKKIVKRERLFIRTPIDLQLALFLFAALISFWNTASFKASFQGITKIFQNYFLLLICAEEIRDAKHVKRIIFACLSGACLASIDGIWQIFTGKDFIRGRDVIINIGLKRATAAFPDANILGIYLGALAPLAIGLFLFYYKGKKRIIFLLINILLLIGIVISFARGTALAVYLAVLFLGIARKSKPVMISLLVLLAASPFILPGNIKGWARQVNYDPLQFMFNSDRLLIYRNSLNMVRAHPVIGVGVNTFNMNYGKYKLPEPEGHKTPETMFAHNHFFQMAGETGLLGLGVFFWLIFALFKAGLGMYRRLKDDYLKVAALSLMAGILSFLLNGITETSLYYARVAMIFWYLIGFLLALNKFAAKEAA